MSNEKKNILITKLPSVPQAIASGFNIIASKVWMISLPVLLDVLLWLGPRIRIYHLVSDQLSSLFIQMNATAPSGLKNQISSMNNLIDSVMKQFNILSVLNTMPIGIPSLLAGGAPLTAPIRGIVIYDIKSVWAALFFYLFLSGLGLLLGCFFFSMTAQETDENRKKLNLYSFIKQIINIILMVIIALIAMILVFTPVSCIIAFLTLLSPQIAQIFGMVVFFGMAWLIIPLFYVPAAIIADRLSVIEAIKKSFTMGRWCSASTSLMLVTAIIISQGLNIIWTIPEAESLMLSIGIFGHAFVSTGLLCAYFILYRRNKEWLKDNEMALKLLMTATKRKFLNKL